MSKTPRTPPTGCSDYEWMVGPLVDGELPPAEAEELERHLHGCASCSRLAEDFRSFDRLAGRLEAPPAVSAEEWGRVWERVRREPRVIKLEARAGVLDWVVPILSLAALVLLAVWIAFALATLSHRKDPNQVEVIRGASEEVQPAPQKPRTGRSS